MKVKTADNRNKLELPQRRIALLIKDWRINGKAPEKLFFVQYCLLV